MLVWQNIKLKRVKMSGNDRGLLFPLFIIEDDKEKNILLKSSCLQEKTSNGFWLIRAFFIYIKIFYRIFF